MPPLFVIQNDTEYVRVRRAGHFAVSRDMSATPEEIEQRGIESFPYLQEAVKTKMQMMRAGLAKKGYEFVESDGFTLRGPMPHFQFDASESPGPVGITRPPRKDELGSDGARWINQMDRASREERARAAKALSMQGGLVDYELVGTFQKATRKSFRPVLSSVAQGGH